jgi:hypothetical protein
VNGAEWPDVTRSARLGRDRTIDVVPSGEGVVSVESLSALLQRDMTRLSRRYDAIILVSSAEQVMNGLSTAMPVSDVLYCVRAGQTPIAQLKHGIEEIERSGAHARGIVLWNAPEPVLADLRPLQETERETVEVS